MCLTVTLSCLLTSHTLTIEGCIYFAAVAIVQFCAAWQILACITWRLLLSEFAGKVYLNSQS